MKTHIPIIIFLCLASLYISADTLQEISRVKITFGRGDNQIGLEQGGGEHWKPLFFSMDDDGNIHIPDFYKARIAVFDTKGKLVKKIPCPKGISPRMNFFNRAPNGMYVTYNDGALCSIGTDGTLKWQHNFGYGIIPSRVVLTSSAIFVVFPSHMDKDGRAVVFDYNVSIPIGRYGTMVNKKNIPLFQWSGDTVFTTRLCDMQLIEGKQGTFGKEKDLLFLSADSKGNSLWTCRKDTTETVVLYSSKGKKLKQGNVYFPEGVAGNGFWTSADNNLTVYKNYFQKDYMEIIGYKFK